MPRNHLRKPEAPFPAPPLPHVNLHIERIVLEGFALSAGQRGVLQEALETELSRLLTTGSGGGAFERLGNGAKSAMGVLQMTAALSPNAAPGALGRDLAQTLYFGMGAAAAAANVSAPGANEKGK